jgi:hypothetical protein
LRFRREERLGCLARARDPLTVITARVVPLLPVVEQDCPDCLATPDIQVELVNFGNSDLVRQAGGDVAEGISAGFYRGEAEEAES